ncbi:TPA: TonB-dependent receptor [Providencia rettgeri]
MYKYKLTPITTAIITALFIPTSALGEKEEHIGTITVQDSAKTIKERDQQGYDDQYDAKGSKIYLGKDLVERYKGTSTADVLNSAVGVYSGDARNSGALDPNIRGIQGQERVPVTVDGTEQSLTVYRGYNGANNRNYVDPNLISSIEIEKSGSLAGDIKTSVGGGIAIRTIGIDDVVAPGEKFGVSLKLETSSNSTRERVPHFGYGEDYRDHPEIYKNNNYVFSDPVVNITPKSRGSAQFFNFKDNGGRIAVGTRQEKFDLMAAYAYRRQGNYFAGKNGAHRYKESVQLNEQQTVQQQLGPDPYLPFAANVFRPGKEVTNTSNELESYLVKTNLYLTENQTLHLGFRRSESTYGEIMPSRLGFAELEGKQVLPQWPLAHFTVNAYNAEYKWKPEDNQWIDLNANVWMTHSVGDTNTSGGYPREPKERDWGFEYGYGGGKDPNIDGSLINTAATNSENDRIGFNLRNTMALTPDLDLTIRGSMLKEKLDSNDVPPSQTASPFIALPRKGHRQETSIAFNFNYRPTSWLELDAGAKYIDGWTEDDYLKEQMRNRTKGFQNPDERLAKQINYNRILTKEEYNEAVANGYQAFNGGYKNSQILLKTLGLEDTDYTVFITKRNNAQRPEENGVLDVNFRAEWKSDSDGRYTTKTNPFHNGTFDSQARAVDPVTGKEVYVYGSSYSHPADDIKRELTEEEKWKFSGKQKSHGWAPAFGANIWLSDNDRVYARYIETVRLPSIFENSIGFAGESEARKEKMLFKPERAKTFEFGYSRNLQGLLGAERHADVKIGYYHTVIENAFDRDGRLNFVQVKEHKTAGIEALARYDNGGVFMDIGVDYRLKNEVCDDSAPANLDPANRYNISQCTTAGFPGGFLRTQLQPKYAINSNLGMRFMDEALEVGTRLRYTSSVQNKDERKLMQQFPGSYSMANNSPMHWTPTFTADAYASYQIDKNINVEFLVTNLTDRYYIDPLTRSMMPAPGRTLRLGLNAQF